MTRQELLDAVPSRSDARPMIQRAVKHYREARRATIQVMADLRLLQDGQVHLLYGERNFAKWAEDTFEGLAAGNVRQLTRAGAVALELDRRELIDLRDPKGVGTTGLRELSVLANDYGNDKMVEVFLTARGMLEDGREVAGTTVKAAMLLLMPPAREEGMGPVPDSLPPSDDGEGEVPDTVIRTELEERVSHIQDLLWDCQDGDKNAYREAMEEMKRLGVELTGKPVPDDQQWIESAR